LQALLCVASNALDHSRAASKEYLSSFARHICKSVQLVLTVVAPLFDFELQGRQFFELSAAAVRACTLFRSVPQTAQSRLLSTYVAANAPSESAKSTCRRTCGWSKHASSGVRSCRRIRNKSLDDNS
jgi:hypothetical protein